MQDKILTNARFIKRHEIHTTFEGLDAPWKDLQQAGFTTPYQTYDWTRQWVNALAAPLNITPAFVLCFSKDDQLEALFPLGIQNKNGFRIASFLGGKHANFGMGLFTPQAMQQLKKEDILDLFRSAAQELSIDAVRLDNQPMQWHGQLNPLAALKSERSASSAWKTALQSDGEAMIAELMSSESRKKLRRKQQKLSELGTISYVETRDAAQAQHILNAFFEQKISRFKHLGIANPFEDQSVIDFITRAALEGLPKDQPAISLYAMLAGEQVLSVFGGSIHAGRFTGMFTSFDSDPVIAKCSPGDLLLMNLVKMLCDKGLQTFDLGTGEANYKGDYCSTEEPLFDTLFSMTPKGYLLTLGLAKKQAAKRWIKKNSIAMNLVQRWRHLKPK